MIPAGEAPHKTMAEGSPSSAERMEMCRRCFGDLGAEISDMEIEREGKSYTVYTVRAIKEAYPGEEIILTMGTDMFLSLDTWHEAEYLLQNVHICVVRRDEEKDAIRAKALEYAKTHRTRTTIIALRPVEASSSEIREKLPQRKGAELLCDKVYEYIISRRLYKARPNFEWLRCKA